MIRKHLLKIKKHVKKHVKNILEIKDSPHAIAAGFTVGTAIAILPTFGLGALIGLGVIFIFKKISKVSMFAAFAVWNAFVLAPLYPLAYNIGDFWYNNRPETSFRFEVNQELYIYSIKFLAGNLFITIIASILSYIIIYLFAKKYQKQYEKYIAEPLEDHVIEPIEKIFKN